MVLEYFWVYCVFFLGDILRCVCVCVTWCDRTFNFSLTLSFSSTVLFFLCTLLPFERFALSYWLNLHFVQFAFEFLVIALFQCVGLTSLLFVSTIKQIWQSIHQRPQCSTTNERKRERQSERELGREWKESNGNTTVIPRRQSSILFVNAFMRRIHNCVHQISVFAFCWSICNYRYHCWISVGEEKSVSLVMWQLHKFNYVQTWELKLSNESAFKQKWSKRIHKSQAKTKQMKTISL